MFLSASDVDHFDTQFYDHFFSWGFQKQIGELIQLRKRVGVNAGSKIQIVAAEADIYVANIDEKLIVKLGPRSVASFSPFFQMGY